MISLWEHVLGRRDAQDLGTGDTGTAAPLPETVNHHKDFNKHVAVLKSRTSLSGEDVIAEAVRFADRHAEAFNDFIYKGDLAKPVPRRSSSSGRINTIVGMMFCLGVLIAVIVMVGGG